MQSAPRPPTAVLLHPHVLIVDDDQELCELMSIRLESRGYRVRAAYDGKQARACIAKERVDAMILDLRLGDEDGLDVMVDVLDRAPGLPVIVLTAHGSIETAVEAMRRGAYAFMTKPFEHDELLDKLAHAVERGVLHRESARTGDPHDPDEPEIRLVGISQPIQQLRSLIGRLGGTDATILVLGESGTGKELVARSLHLLSPRHSKPFVPINCGALPPELLTSELFGHVKGSFTGATQDRDGLFGAARGGTLFLDEIGEASSDVQVRLLRVLQDQRYTPVGSTEERHADVRIIAATNRDLRADVAAKRFREDLFYRLHVVPLALPPLRDRIEDVPLLAEMFIERAAARHRQSAPRLTQDALDLMSSYRWPGNIRELMHVMEAAVLLSPGETIDAEALQPLLLEPERAGAVGGKEEGAAGPGPGRQEGEAGDAGYDEGMLASWFSNEELPPFTQARRAFEKMYLAEALRRAGGNVTAAAKMAGRHRSDFYDLLRRHNLRRDHFRPD